jgi:hypothetical protein
MAYFWARLGRDSVSDPRGIQCLQNASCLPPDCRISDLYNFSRKVYVRRLVREGALSSLLCNKRHVKYIMLCHAMGDHS